MNTMLAIVAIVLGSGLAAGGPDSMSSQVISLDGEWLLKTDPAAEGVAGEWFKAAQPEAVATRVPWIIQDAYPGYHGVAWYWKEFPAPVNPHKAGRYLLRFWAVDYKADVWVNGKSVGGHEGGETPFVLDVTDAVRSDSPNLVAVRVLNPKHEPIDGIVLNETPHRNKVIPYTGGGSYNHGGIVDSVELVVAPPQRVSDVFAMPDMKTGDVTVQATITNTANKAVSARLEFNVGPAMSGETVDTVSITRDLPPGESPVEAKLHIDTPRLWCLNDPALYRVSVRVQADGSPSRDENSVRCGFRDFRFENGYFRLNGKRLFLRCSHTGNHCPVGLQLPPDPDMLRRDLINVKMMGFNSIRFIAGVATRYQLDLCDELGLMVYEEHFGSWCLADSPQMADRFDRGLVEMIKRDRNHPSIVMWGMLNETTDTPVFRHAVNALSLARECDTTRLIMLNSGRFDGRNNGTMLGMQIWQGAGDGNPNVMHNPTGETKSSLGITWQPGQLSLHPGPNGEYGVVRWTCPAAGTYAIQGAFSSIAERATTDMHVIQGGKSLWSSSINLDGHGAEQSFDLSIQAAANDTIDFVLGYGNGNYGADTTALALQIVAADGKVFDAAKDYSTAKNPNGVWSYGSLAPGTAPDTASFGLFPFGTDMAPIGSLSNPGSSVWEDVLNDQHPYQPTPHTAPIINFLRTVDGGPNPVFISEYGVGSGVDLWRVARHYEQLGKAGLEDAQFYREKLDRFLADWQKWKLDECFADPQDFFAQSLRKMAGQRLLGLNAIRANPRMAGHSLTGTVDQGMSGEGMFTTFRELKPGTTDALFEALAPLRLCLFVEPANVYRGGRVHVEAVLANEDVLAPGEYPVRMQVVGPKMTRCMDKVVNITVPAPADGKETPLAIPVFAEDVAVDGPSGTYRFLAHMEQGGAPLGGETEFTVTDAKEMPAVETEVTLWGEDAELATWLTSHGIRTRAYSPETPARRELILVSSKAREGDGVAVWSDLAQRIARGSAVVFLSPGVFARDNNALGWLPLKNKGSLPKMGSWLYHKDEWAKARPVFDGLQCGGLMDYLVYRDIIPELAFAGLDAPDEAIAGANDVSCNYASGLMLATYRLGAGRFAINTLHIRELLDKDPGAERLLRNLLRYMAQGLDTAPADVPGDFAEQLAELGYR